MRLRLDDYLLLCSTASLIAATGLLYYGTRLLFLGADLEFNPSAAFEAESHLFDLMQEVTVMPKINWAYLTLSWTTIFLIKFGFLSLFRQLVDRVPAVYKFWKGTLIFTALGLEVVECSTNWKIVNRALAIGILPIILDIVTDLLSSYVADSSLSHTNIIQVLTIPVWLLWRVQIGRKQKLGLAGFLCLNICMIIMAIVRVSGIRYRGVLDLTWTFMWQHIEACVAIAMLSLTAFRSVFVASKPNANNNRASPWAPSTRRMIAKYKISGDGELQRLDDVPIPSATITGLSHVRYPSGIPVSMNEVSFSSSFNDRDGEFTSV
ncbi:MAG: hypothetical protein Q9219_007106 [cf. Caloplaca sp. 3 TL-2023]